MSFQVKQKDQIAKGTGRRQGGVEQNVNVTSIADACTPKSTACVCGGTCPACQSGTIVQTKLRRDEQGDRLEMEAERVANNVIASDSDLDRNKSQSAFATHDLNQTSLPTLQRKESAGNESDDYGDEAVGIDESELTYLADMIERYEHEVYEGDAHAQAKQKDDGAAMPSCMVDKTIGSLSSGQMMSPSVLGYFGQRMGMDFSAVRIHSDDKAAKAAESINARAFTLGSDVVFNRGEYSPHTREGRHLLAHELTHVVQQSNGQTQHVQRQKKKQLPSWALFVIELMRLALSPLSWLFSSGKNTRSSTSPATSMNASAFLKNTKLVNLFFSDLNGVIKGISGRVSSLSLSNYDIKAPKDYVTSVTRNRFSSDYMASLKQATEACGTAIIRQCGADQSCLSTIREYQKASSGFCKGKTPTMDGVANFVINRGYTRVRYNRVMGDSVVIRERETDALLNLFVHEGLHRLAGNSWKVRCNSPVGSQYKHSVKGVTLKRLSDDTDEGATQLLTLEIIRKMQAIKGRNWFMGFKVTAYSTQVKDVQRMLTSNKKNINFLEKAYFSNTSYREVEDIQYWQ